MRKNNGREWQAKGQDTTVNVYDYRSIADGKAIPYGIYDLAHNTGFVNVGIDHETAEFAVESIRRWWQSVGKELYPTGKELFIIADGGGSNGARNRLWKMQLQRFATQTGLTVTVCHLPPATSKWNKIEPGLFSYISINWRGKPLRGVFAYPPETVHSAALRHLHRPPSRGWDAALRLRRSPPY
jgi:Rhodopirellula transposase DDE domain